MVGVCIRANNNYKGCLLLNKHTRAQNIHKKSTYHVDDDDFTPAAPKNTTAKKTEVKDSWDDEDTGSSSIQIKGSWDDEDVEVPEPVKPKVGMPLLSVYCDPDSSCVLLSFLVFMYWQRAVSLWGASINLYPPPIPIK